MPIYTFIPNSQHTAHISLTVTAGLSCTITLFIATKVNPTSLTDSSVIAIANAVSFVSTGSVQTINCPITLPNSLPSKVMYACADVIYNGQLILALVDSTNTIQAGSNYGFTIDQTIQSGVSYGVANSAWTQHILQFKAQYQINKSDWQAALSAKGLPSNYVPVFLFTLSGNGWTSEYFMSTQDGGTVWESGNPAYVEDLSIGENDYYTNVPFSLICNFNPYVGLTPMPLGTYTISCRIAYMANYSTFQNLPTTLETNAGQCNLAQHPASSDFVTVIGPFNPGVTTQCIA